ncbi:sulfite exporter TauE/SafE family protein [Pedobacter nototheniae]|uniref:sulfite exporter TauE/SafE family protein n=1 Tax=Pedobacter nototheniae TaxID=2488994 RepID=UPI00103EC228|nr:MULTISPECIES: sulfite exporter TauE/SafE family protein [Pedobacter]
MISYLPLAFIMGLLGSLHCAVMCGPLMLGLPFQKNKLINTAFQLLIYQFGRILIYTSLGFIVGALGSSLRVFSNQKSLSILIGAILILFTILHLSAAYQKKLNGFQLILIKPISKMMAKVFKLPFWSFFAGMLNGLIPCGMVYLALATALNTSTLKGGGTFMFLFGLGTTPLMLMISLGGVYLKKYIRFNTQKLIPWFMLFIGILFILRASDLGIPFLSPNSASGNHGSVVECR